MRYPYVVIYYSKTPNQSEFDELFEVASSTYVSKKVRNSFIIIGAEILNNPKEIYKTLKAKLKPNFSFLIVELNQFYGNFPQDVIVWLKETFPEGKYIP